MALEQADVSTPLVVQRWTRYGHDRAYVKVGEQDLGYRDLKSGAVECSRAEFIDTITQATNGLLERVQAATAARAYQPRHGAPEVDAAAERNVEVANRPSPSIPLLPDRDLAGNVPGQAVRQIATDLREAAPVRTFLARVVGAKNDERAHRIGAEGEVEVARRLARLGPEWKVLHAVPIGERGSDIDHVVIGPAGVFTINAKNHPQASVWVGGDVVKVNGYNQPYVHNSRFEAQRAAKLLTAAAGFDVEVRALIAIMGAHRGLTVKEQPRDGVVAVIARKQVDVHLRALQQVLGAPSIDRIYDVARHLATWHPKTVRREDF